MTGIFKKIAAAAVALALAGCESIGLLGNDTSALVIGVQNGYAGICPGSARDASDMKNLLGKYASDVKVLTNEKATASAVYAAMLKAVESDLAIIYFSGHGGSMYGGDESEADGHDEYICCFDGDILDDDIWKVVLRAKGRVFLIFDCCHSETMFRQPGVTMRKAANRLSGARAGKVPKMLCWSGCPDDSYSYGSVYGGFFTSSLLRHVDSKLSYNQVWTKIASDRALAESQSVRRTQIGDFGAGERIFR